MKNTCGKDMGIAQWTFKDYWRKVAGELFPADVVLEFGLNPCDRTGLSEWLADLEYSAWHGTEGTDYPGMPMNWQDFHREAIELLTEGWDNA